MAEIIDFSSKLDEQIENKELIAFIEECLQKDFVAQQGKKRYGYAPRIQDLCDCANFITDSLLELGNPTGGSFGVGMAPLSKTTGCIMSTMRRFHVDNMSEFCRLFSKASTIEFVPKEKQFKFDMNFTFNNVAVFVKDGEQE